MDIYIRRQSRRAQLLRLYKASGSALPFSTWLKHHQQATKVQSTPAPGGWAVSVCVALVMAAALLLVCKVITCVLGGCQ